MKFINAQCPSCNASLSIEEGRTTAFCTYCGTKVILYNENEKVFRSVDEAAIKKAEVQKEIEIEKIKNQEKENKRNFIFGILYIGLFIFIILILGIGACFESFDGFGENQSHIDGIAMPYSDNAVERVKDYSEVVDELTELGFTNIETYPHASPTVKIMGLENKIYSIKINSKAPKAGKKYDPKSSIVIEYFISNMF